MLLGILLTLLVVVCVLLIAVILMQRSEGGALGMGGGGGGFLSTRGTADLLTRTTQILGFLFFVLCLTITVVTARSQGSGSLIDRATVGKIDTDLLKKQAPAPSLPPPGSPAPGQVPDGFQAPLPSIGDAPAPATPAGPIPSAPLPTAPTR